MLRTIAEIAGAIGQDGRLASWSVGAKGDGFCEVDLGASVLVLVAPALWRDPARLAPHLLRSRSGVYPLVLFGAETDFVDGRVEAIDDPTITLAVLPISSERLAAILRGEAERARRSHDMARRDLQLVRARYETDLLISVGRALSQERDIDSLLAQILRRAREVTGADAGSVYVVEGDAEEVSERTLRFMVSQNESVAVQSKGFTMPISASSIVGTCVLAQEAINIVDLYDLDAPGSGNNPWGFKHDRSFDEKHGYQTRAMLTVPMISARDQVIGVIQLINKRGRGVARLATAADFESKVVPFDQGSSDVAQALASQAGIALENAMLYDEVRRLFEGFVHASVTAIESRDPTTSGHSHRVAELTTTLARAADRIDHGPYAGLRFSFDDLKQIEYAALLHDFGKVGVREHVLVKAKKLYEHQRDLVLARFDFVRKAIETEQLTAKVRTLMDRSRDQIAAELHQVDRDAEARLAEIDEFIQFVLKANEPTVLEEGGFGRIVEIAKKSYVDPRGQVHPYLTAEEVVALQIPRGSLTEDERVQIQSHVVHTYNFLRQIPWGRVFNDIPELAGSHHEKLDGSGYPRGLLAAAIPAPARMMTISDIYDALTAADRPYKRAVPEDRALGILEWEVKAGKLDADLFQLFVDAKVYEVVRVA
jgi:HD-GYP domain-containing protein (c-di-GMP phosphodiesterase class II)